MKRIYAFALTIMAVLILGSCLLMQAAFDIQEVKLRLSVLATDQSRLFTDIGSMTHGLMQSAASNKVPEQSLQTLRSAIKEKISRVRANTTEILTIDRGRLFGLFKGGAVAQLYIEGPVSLERKLNKFLGRAEDIAEMDTARLRNRLQQWSPIDVVVSSGAMMQNDFDQLMLNSFKSTEQNVRWVRAIELFISAAAILLIVMEAFFIFAPLVRRFRSEHESTILYEEKLRFQARIDGLSGLGNRLAFKEHLSTAIDESRRTQALLGLILFDLDRFKPINDSLGHAAGDVLLRAVAERAQARAGPEAFVARLGGDEFGILVRNVDGEATLRALANGVKQAIELPVRYESHEISPMASFGGAIHHPADPTGTDGLLRAADTALYKAKRQRIGFAFLDEHMKSEAAAEIQIATDFRHALERAELDVFYQPQVRLADNRIVGFEGLIRWRHPERGLLAPGTFLPVARRHGLMTDLTVFVVNRVSDDLRRWFDRSCDPGVIAVNMPEAMLASGLARQVIDQALARNALDCRRIRVEVTEDVLLDRNSEQIIENLRAMQTDGIGVAFDDFGTGYASLSHLKRFPLDEIKIDRSFIRDIDEENSGAEIVRSLIQLAARLKKTVVAEGIETLDQLRFLVDSGCQFGQGYLFSRPVPFEATIGLLQANQLKKLGDAVNETQSSFNEYYKDVA